MMDMDTSSLLEGLNPSIDDDGEHVLEALLRGAAQRDVQLRARWHESIFDDALAGLGDGRGSDDVAHGSLLVLIELLDAVGERSSSGSLDAPRLERTYEAVWALRESRHRHVRLAILALLPRLAASLISF